MTGLSIHPRNWPENKGNSVKKNTCKPYMGKGKLGKKQKRLSMRRVEHSATLSSLDSNVNPLAYKAPGSMNQHK